MKNSHSSSVTCYNCHASFVITKGVPDQNPLFCIYCGTSLSKNSKDSHLGSMEVSQGTVTSRENIALIQGHSPENESIEFTIGPYQIMRAIGKGGMGEVFLAYDTTCGRRIALKRIRQDLMEHIQMHNRFLKEARITSQLTHPSIIPIYAIQGEDNLIYYTMPFVEGNTLKQIFRTTRVQEKKGLPLDHIGGSIPALVRIFLNICQAIAYAHSKNVLHRDIKPENIIIGQFGEVLILDWGLAKLIGTESKPSEEFPIEITKASENKVHQLTNIGKVVGTISYMAPERARGSPATQQTDIYSLGVILYQILTLRHPFKRGTLKQFRENMHTEVLHDPIQVAPYREVPRILAQIAMKCLNTQLDQRYHTVQELIRDIENYIEGRAEWFHIAQLDINSKLDWEFQENVLIAEHVAITRGTEVSDWVNLMISKTSFSDNIKIEAKVKLGEKGHGLGFLLSIPEASERTHLNDGYCLWLGSEQNRSTKLLKSTVEVLHVSDVFLQPNESYHIKIEKVDHSIHFYLNNVLQFSYISHLPLVGTHVGLLARDADFSLKDFNIFVGSQNVTVNCLAVPDAFLAHKDYTTALSEYRRIGYSFPGRTEGREAMFRAGITLLEQARNTPNYELAQKLYDHALEEFEKLHGTPGAPLEYLGKALVYQTLSEYDEELKCFELAYRRYPRHPLLNILKEQIVYRMHAVSRYHRQVTYKFVLLVVRHLPDVAKSSNAKKLFSSLKRHWEPLAFIDETENSSSEEANNSIFATVLAFWLAKPYVICEIIDEQFQKEEPLPVLIFNALYCLLELGAMHIARDEINKIESEHPEFFKNHFLSMKMLKEACLGLGTIDSVLDVQLPDPERERLVLFYMHKALDDNLPELVHAMYSKVNERRGLYTEQFKVLYDSAEIWACLLEGNLAQAGALLHSYSLELLNQETTPLHFLYGCWLYATEGKEIAHIHFSGILDTPYPRSWTLFSHFHGVFLDPHTGWFQKAFMWERRQFFRQMILFSHCAGDDKGIEHFNHLLQQEFYDSIH